MPSSMPSNAVTWDINESVAVVTVNRPEARNALTWEMYDAIVDACDQAEANRDVRVLIIRGSGKAAISTMARTASPTSGGSIR